MFIDSAPGARRMFVCQNGCTMIWPAVERYLSSSPAQAAAMSLVARGVSVPQKVKYLCSCRIPVCTRPNWVGCPFMVIVCAACREEKNFGLVGKRQLVTHPCIHHFCIKEVTGDNVGWFGLHICWETNRFNGRSYDITWHHMTSPTQWGSSRHSNIPLLHR